VNEEQVFLLGLDDGCPRCGEFFGKGYSEEDKREHLRTCTDTIKHKAHAKEKKKLVEKAVQREVKSNKQVDAQAQATWEVLGGRTDQLWLLSEEQLRAMAKEGGSDGTGSREELIMIVAAQRGVSSGVKALTGGTTAMESGNVAKRYKLTAESLPDNYQAMSIQQLKGVCAAHGFIPKGKVKADVLREIENELDSDKPLMLKGAEDPIPEEDPEPEEESDEEFAMSDDDEPLSKRKSKKKAKTKKAVAGSKAEPVHLDASSDDDAPLANRSKIKKKVISLDSSDDDEPLSKRTKA